MTATRGSWALSTASETLGSQGTRTASVPVHAPMRRVRHELEPHVGGRDQRAPHAGSSAPGRGAGRENHAHIALAEEQRPGLAEVLELAGRGGRLVLDYAEGQPLRLYVDLGQREVPRTVDLVTPLRTHDERELIPGRDALWGPALDAKALQALREAARLELVDGQTLARSELTETAAPFPCSCWPPARQSPRPSPRSSPKRWWRRAVTRRGTLTRTPTRTCRPTRATRAPPRQGRPRHGPVAARVPALASGAARVSCT
jgi:hypothetical protein